MKKTEVKAMEENMDRTEGRRRSGKQRMRRVDGITESMDMSLSSRRR